LWIYDICGYGGIFYENVDVDIDVNEDVDVFGNQCSTQ
jgi:hypothetical protein